MALEGLHHVTAITADAPRNVDFYARVLGLRLIKKTVDFDRPEVYHLYYGDELATPGSVLTFFEFPGAGPGRHGDGMPYRILWRVAGDRAIDFWCERLCDEGVGFTHGDAGVLFADHEGLEHQLVIDDACHPLLASIARDIPPEHALQGFAGVRAYASQPGTSARLLGALGFVPSDGDSGWRLAGERRRARWDYDLPPAAPGIRGAGSITTWRGRRPTTTSCRTFARSPPPRARGRRRSSTASTFTPCTSASPAACCSSSRPAMSASPSTSRSRRSAGR